MYELGHFIDGKRVCRHERSPSATSSTRQRAKFKAPVALASDADLGRRRRESAKAAQPNWAATNPQRRARVFMKFVQLLNDNMNELAEMLSREHGKTIDDAKGDIVRGLEVCEFVIGIPHLRRANSPEGAGPGIDMYSIRQPVGVGAGITPFNFPGMIPDVMFAPAIACAMHSSSSLPNAIPPCRSALPNWMIEAGLPAGILNVVTVTRARWMRS